MVNNPRREIQAFSLVSRVCVRKQVRYRSHTARTRSATPPTVAAPSPQRSGASTRAAARASPASTFGFASLRSIYHVSCHHWLSPCALLSPNVTLPK